MPVQVMGGGGAGGPPGADISCRVRLLANQSIPNNVLTNVNWTTEDYDTDGMHDNAVNNDRITFNTAGKYLVNFNTIWFSNNTGLRLLAISQSAAGLICRLRNEADFNSEGSIAGIFDMLVGSFIVAQVIQSSGVALNLLSDASTNMAVQKIDRGG